MNSALLLGGENKKYSIPVYINNPQTTQPVIYGFDYKIDFSVRLFESFSKDKKSFTDTGYSALLPQQGVNYIGRKYAVKCTYKYTSTRPALTGERLAIIQPVDSWDKSKTVYTLKDVEGVPPLYKICPQLFAFNRNSKTGYVNNHGRASTFLLWPWRDEGVGYEGVAEMYGKMINTKPLWMLRNLDRPIENGYHPSLGAGDSVEVLIKGTIYYE